MSEDWSGLKWLGPFAAPIAITLSLIGLIVTFQSHAATVGWRVISSIFFLVTLIWSVWYLRATTTEEPSKLADIAPRKVFRHNNKWLRRLVYSIPVVAAVLCAAAFLQPNEIDYSELLEGGGPYSPMVVFDSNPRGAEVRVAKSYYADDDPWLEDKNNENIHRLPEPTLTRARIGQGHYWVVFELNGKRKQQYLIVAGPKVVKVDF